MTTVIVMPSRIDEQKYEYACANPVEERCLFMTALCRWGYGWNEPFAWQEVVNGESESYGTYNDACKICYESFSAHHLINDEYACHVTSRACHKQNQSRTWR